MAETIPVVIMGFVMFGLGVVLPLWAIFGDHSGDREISAFFGTIILAAETYAICHAFEPAPWVWYAKAACVAVYLGFWAYLMSQDGTASYPEE